MNNRNTESIPGLDIVDGVNIELPLFGDSFHIPSSLLKGDCRFSEEFENTSCSRVGKLEEFYQCLDSRSYKQVTLVKYKGFNSLSYEVKALVQEVAVIKKLNHSNILKFLEPAVHHLSSMHLVFEPFPCFISDLIQYKVVELYTADVVKNVMFQLLSGLNYLHEHAIMHRNIHPNNLAISSNGELKICNFRNARHLWDKNLILELEDFRYQSLEALMELFLCSTPSDIWSAACIFVELLLEKKFLKGEDKSSVMGEIFAIFGFPSQQCWPKFYELPESTFYSEELSKIHQYNFLETYFKKELHLVDENTMDLLQAMFCLDPTERPKAFECLNFSYFKNDSIACKNDKLIKCITVTLSRKKAVGYQL